jgi:hypothetical protein
VCIPSWEALLPEWGFKDQRLRRRTLAVGQAMMENPGLAFTGVFGKTTKNTKQAYDLCENPRMSLASILRPAVITTGEVVRKQLDTVLVLQDSTEFDLSTHKAMRDIGEIGNPKNRGIFLHTGFAVTPRRLPVGLLSALTWVRDPLEHGKTLDRKSKPFDEKESLKWWTTIENAERAVRAPGKLVHVGDRESDIFDLFTRCVASGYRGLFRAAQDRKVLDAQHGLLWAEAESWPAQEKTLTIDVPERLAHDTVRPRLARTAELAIRFGSVTIGQPGDGPGRVTVWAVLVRELSPPSPSDVIEWLLLSTDEVLSAEDAWTRVDWYRCRWLIEEFHKCMKTTCRIEERQFQKRATFETYLALVMLVSVRILFFRNLARVEPDAPARQILSPEEELVLSLAHSPGARPPSPLPLTVYRAVRMIAMLGGFLARKGDGEPGFQTLARGYAKLATLVDGFRLSRGLQIDVDHLLSELQRSPAVLFPWLSAQPSPH